MSKYVVYVHMNKINGKKYVGITNNPARRWSGNGKNYEQCPRFRDAIAKYGWDNFTHEFLEEGLTIDEANQLEREYIAKYKTQDGRYGYNISPGGQYVPSMLGKHHSEETKQKMRLAALGHPVSDEQKQKISEALIGKMRGKRNGKSRPVRCITTGEVFESQGIAAEAKGVPQSKICLCCQGKRAHTHGLKWEYVGGIDGKH